VDVAPTVAKLLGLKLPHADGRVLDEALAGSDARYLDSGCCGAIIAGIRRQVLFRRRPGLFADRQRRSVSVELREKVLSSPDGLRKYVYVDSAKATRAETDDFHPPWLGRRFRSRFRV